MFTSFPVLKKERKKQLKLVHLEGSARSSSSITAWSFHGTARETAVLTEESVRLEKSPRVTHLGLWMTGSKLHSQEIENDMGLK